MDSEYSTACSYLTEDESSRKLKSERQKRHYHRKKEKQKDLETETKTIAGSLALAQAENEHLSIMETVLAKLLHSADYLLGEVTRVLGRGQGRQAQAVSHHRNDIASTTALGTGDTDSNLTMIGHASCVLAGPEEPSEEFMMEIFKQPIEVLVKIDTLLLELILPACKKLASNSGDLSAREEILRWANRRRCIMSAIYRERPISLLELASKRVLPLHSDGNLNACLYDLPSQMKLTAAQYERMQIKWEKYKLRIKNEFLNASARTSRAGLTLNALDGLEALKSLDDLEQIHASALVSYFWSFVDDLMVSQRAAMLAACAPYAPDILQISAMLFDAGTLEGGAIQRGL